MSVLFTSEGILRRPFRAAAGPFGFVLAVVVGVATSARGRQPALG